MKIENAEVYGFIPAMRAMRNPLDSWDKSDSYDECDPYSSREERFIIGEKDLELSQRLVKAGSEHCKHLRMIQVWVDLTLPRYIHCELDTYQHINKISCSTMHKITSRLLTFDDFEYAFTKEKPLQVFQKPTFYSEEEREWKTIENFESYEVSNDGKVRNIKKQTIKVKETTVDNNGYSKTKLCKNGDVYQFSVHRLVLQAFNPIANYDEMEVNHKDGNKLNNKVENLEWATSSENQIHAYNTKLQLATGVSKRNQAFGVGKLNKEDIENIKFLNTNGMSQREIGKKYNLYHSSIGDILKGKSYSKDIDSEDVLINIIININKLINMYNCTKTPEKKNELKLQIKSILPESFLQKRTINTNYQTLLNMYNQRKNHELPQWHTICDWIINLPYFRELTGIENC